MESTPPSEPAASPGRLPLRLVGAAVIVIGLIVLGRRAGGYLPQFTAWVEGLGVWAPVVFIAGYAVAAVAFIPGSILTLAAGAIFGLLKGTVYAWVAATIGSAAAFLISRNIARTAIERRLTGNPRFASIDRAVGREGRKIVFLLRLSPVFPFSLLNYGLGLTRVRFVDYLIASVGMLPGTVLYVYYGKLAGDVAKLAGGVPSERGAESYAALLIGLVATILATALITRTARRALAEATRDPSET